MAKSLEEWLGEGQELYDAAVEEYRKLEEQAQEIQQRMLTKRAEVNQIAKVIAQPPIDETRTATTATTTTPPVDVVDVGGPNAGPFTRNTIARALTGQPLRR